MRGTRRSTRRGLDRRRAPVCARETCLLWTVWGNYTRMRHVYFGVREYIFFFVWDYVMNKVFLFLSDPILKVGR